MKKLLIFIFFVFSIVNCYSQLTPYNKAVREAGIKYYMGLGFDKKLTERVLDDKLTLQDKKLIQSSDFQKKLFLFKQSEKGILLGKQLDKELIEAEKLKNAKELEIDRLAKFEKSSLKSFQDSVNKDYSEWLEKGQFEKSEDYKNRLTNKIKAYDHFCLEYLKHFIDRRLEMQLFDYDADKEQFPVTVNLKREGIFINGTLNVPINEAEKVANFWGNTMNSGYEAAPNSILLGVGYLKIYENNIIPAKFLFRINSNKERYEFNINSYERVSDIELNSDNVPSAFELKHTFKLNEYL